jgi:hypothetical protein
MDMVLRLRIAVAYLREKEQFAWWATQFLSASGVRFLRFIYPRSAFAAAVNAATERQKHSTIDGSAREGFLISSDSLTPLKQRMSACLLSRNDDTLSCIFSRGAQIESHLNLQHWKMGPQPVGWIGSAALKDETSGAQYRPERSSHD